MLDDYVIVVDCDLDTIAKEVNELIAKGYKPKGPLTPIVWPPEEFEKASVQFIQTMVNKEL